MVSNLLFGHKNKSLQIDLGGMHEEKDKLIEFLKSTLKVDVTHIENKLALNDEKVSPQEVQRVVTKFVYRRNLNNIYWVSVDGNTIKVNKFENAAAKKTDKKKKSSGHQTITQSWGL